MVIHIGSLATISRKPRQARKGATVVVDSGAEVMLVWVASTFLVSLPFCFSKKRITQLCRRLFGDVVDHHPNSTCALPHLLAGQQSRY